MGGLNPSVDFGVGLNPASSQLPEIVEAIQRQAGQLDSFNQQLSFSASGSLSIVWDGTSGANLSQSFAHGLNYAPIFLMYCKFAAETKWRPCDDIRIAAGTGLATVFMFGQSDATNLTANFQSQAAGTADTAQFKWFLLREPAQ